MKKLLLLISLLSITGVAMSQTENNRKWVEVDVSISPYAKPLYDGGALSADVAVRYCFSKHFSAGLGVSTWITPKTRMFAELSLAFFDDIYTLYAPLSIGFRF